MTDFKKHTPTGMNDILPRECAKKKEIENTLWSVFASFGYREVEAPMFEYYDVYAGESGSASRGLLQENMFKFFDEKGRILALRPEITTSIARMASTKLENAHFPMRFCYTGSVFRSEDAYAAKQCEFTQSGIELLGASTPEADAEVIAAAIEALIAIGFEEFHMEIGQVGFFNGLTEQAGLSPDQIESLRERIDSKNTLGISEITDKLDLNENVKKLMLELPYLFGGTEIFKKADVKGLCEKSKNALDNIKKIYDILIGYGFEKFVSVDLGMLQSIDYYTGSIFKCYTHGIGFPICAGGRYDNLLKKFGKDISAVGISFSVNRLVSVLGKDAVLSDDFVVPKTVIFAEENAQSLSYDLAYNLRINGCMTEGYVGGKDYKDAEEYSIKSGAECMMRVFADGRLLIKDFIKNEIIETTTEAFLEYNNDYYEDEDDCDCGCDHDHDHECHHHH